MSSLQILNACKSYGTVEVLKDINLDVQSGEFVVFVGPSGCGKSTLLRTIAGLEDITAGEIRLGGKRINDVDAAKRGVAMVFQSYALYPHMTVAQNMGFSMRLAKAPKKETEERVRKAAHILQLEKLLERKPAQLSGGQKQRVAIGRAIVREPKVFLFDEPLSNLDAELRVQMRAELAQLHRRLGNTMIYVTHDQVEAMTLADKMVVLNVGKVQQVGHPLELYDNPDNMFVAGFVGTPRMNFIKARVLETGTGGTTVEYLSDHSGGRLQLPLKNSTYGAEAEVWLGIRPDHVKLCEASDAKALPLTISFIEELGDSTCLHGALPNATKLSVLTHGGRRDEQTPVTIRIDPERVFVFDRNGERIRD
ncbi:sn-glycerol-3-phosphate ABC transporter ATP-binding protein UgpC [Sinorhizobium medicae]|uniref:ABC transporter ATP-binding protein n=1 Tax=Sinorhizobium medicae TaxID=110321 RepID=UPI000C79B5D4|nr:sn-glycerol-3-phosphate ABC transporter ATP-binding protein UgpC [Sinorhizobium medicae]PLU48369.1 ABC transporter ATP-binding protein [Sinorhizobium medicae]RVQ47441.1 sn-glycerol-3-phosphate ABC transporter ATP-binding protein UgpC [Sinorhizobium medicae]